MRFENLNAATFYVTAMGENQAAARQLFTKCRSLIYLGWRLPMEGGTRISATGVDEMWLYLGVKFSSRGFGPPELTN